MKYPNDNDFTSFTNINQAGPGGIQFAANATAPTDSDLTAGRVYFDSTLGKLRVYNGTDWEDVTSA